MYTPAKAAASCRTPKLWRALIGVVLLLLFAAQVKSDAPETIGRIEGSFTARGQVTITQDGTSSVTTLLSGSEVTVREGHARVTMVDGSELDVCGPANFSLLKSGGAVTLALNHGRVHGRISGELPLAIFTTMIVATPVSISREPRDFVVALDTHGTLGIRAEHGAVRLENQFSGQSVLVPRYAEMQLKNGQLETLAAAVPGTCHCEIPVVAKAQPAPQPPIAALAAATKAEVSVAAPNVPKPQPSNAAPPRSATEIPTFTAVMPPLTFDANAPAPPLSTRPEMILLIREVRVQPATIYTGRVERSAPPQRATAPATRQASAESPAASKPSFGTRFANFFRRLFGGKPKN